MDDFPPLKVIEVCKVAPSPPIMAAEESSDAAVPSSLPLTFFDLLWLRFHPVHRLFFYELSYNEISFVDVIVPKLKSSLSHTLRHYLPLAGNLVWPLDSDVPFIKFVEGDGVYLTVAESDGNFEHLSGNGFRETCDFRPLVPQLVVSHDRAAPIAIQVTRFGNKGFSIGITIHHAILDGSAATSFIKSWAKICMEESSIPIAKLMPFYDRSLIDDSKGLAKLYAKAWLDMEGPNNRSLILKLPKTKHGLVTCNFEFTHQNIQKLKQCVLKKKDNQESGSHVSSFAVATAYLCVCTAKLEASREGKLCFVFAADARTRLKPPVPSKYFGNCLVGSFIGWERNEILGENGMVLACEEISKTIRDLKEVVIGSENMGLVMSELTQDYSKVEAISLAGSPKFGVYSVDFGWGIPKKVEIPSAESPYVFSLTEGRNSDVVMEVGVVKEREEMEAFVAIFNEGFESLKS